MLDTATKRRIDTARDILVGKVPDPKSQVEQITIALIYKFMDDMDAEAEEFGGKRNFFANEFARYGWAKLMRSGLGGHETLNLYAEAIAKMPENPGIPLLFRDIFKNAYLPYRDPETLRAFLKIIDEFNYDHSEKLGDAFEYLLSVLGSQGDAGQFRTPRHIIDFIVEIIDPKKNETVLDPACGTAGFLISSYKHILKANTDGKGNTTLTPEEKGRLAGNFKGYDISPDMVRLSLVNMYLHGFADPHIYEYDTLTSQDRWNEYADVILANPPFMSPKGGIKPHNRFSVQSKRSEVLFVDYMAEHLTPSGRAGIIVPEGIIFQSQNAYTQLRKILVEEYLIAVISLPAGVFNPYSGVKTSILILDKSLARKTNTLGFFKVDNDGFGLGAQRREIDKNDLPQAQIEIADYLRRLQAGEKLEGYQPTLGLIVEKEKTSANGEYNLSAERYRKSRDKKRKFEAIELGSLCKPEYGFTASAADSGDARFVRITDIGPDGRLRKEEPKYINLTQESEPCLLQKGDLLVARTGATFGKTMLFDEDYSAVFASYLIRLRFPKDLLLPEFYWSFAQSEKYWEQARNLVTGGGQPQFNGNAITKIRIPLPPLDVQKEIVAEIEGYQKVIDGARAVLDNYRPCIPIHPDWPMVSISDVSAKITKGSSPTWQGIEYTSKGKGILFITSENVGLGQMLLEKPKYVERRFNDIEPKSILRRSDVLTNIVGASIGRTAIFDLDIEANVNQAVCIIRPNTALVNSTYLMTLLNSPEFIQKLLGNSVENARANVSMGVLGSLTIPLPSIEIQQSLVVEIEAEQALVAANRELIARFEKKIQATLARVWGEDETTTAEA
jgi:type I restriction enzyme M protein